MNIIVVIKTNTVNDIPAALRELADIAEYDIKIQGCRANAMGSFDAVSGEFDYEISSDNITSIVEFIEKQ